MTESAVFRAADGSLVVEVDLRRPNGASLPQLIANAKAAGADALWAYGPVVDEALGFRARGGHARLEAPTRPQPVELASPPLHLVRDLQFACFDGVLGHREPDEPGPEATYVGLCEASGWVGICEVDPGRARISGPGVVPELRTPDRYARLVQGAAAHLAAGPATLETWGDTEDTLAAYEELGLRLVEYTAGWELRFRT